MNKRYDPQTDARLTALILAIVAYKIKGKDIQSGLVQWEQQILSLERDHKEVLSAKIRRALLMNILLAWMQGRVMEHLDRLKTYAAVRGKVVALYQTIGGAEPDVHQVEPQWQQEFWPEEEEGEGEDLNALANTCHNCGGTGHFARNCSSPAKPRASGILPTGPGKSGGKALGKARGKGGKTGKG